MTNPNSEVRHIRTVRERLSLASSETDADLNTRLSALSVDQQLELSRLYDELDQAVEVVRGKLGPEPDPSYEPSRHRMIAGKEQFIRDRALTFAKQEPFGQDAISAELRNRDASADDFVEVESLERLQIRGFKARGSKHIKRDQDSQDREAFFDTADLKVYSVSDGASTVPGGFHQIDTGDTARIVSRLGIIILVEALADNPGALRNPCFEANLNAELVIRLLRIGNSLNLADDKVGLALGAETLGIECCTKTARATYAIGDVEHMDGDVFRPAGMLTGRRILERMVRVPKEWMRQHLQNMTPISPSQTRGVTTALSSLPCSVAHLVKEAVHALRGENRDRVSDIDVEFCRVTKEAVAELARALDAKAYGEYTTKWRNLQSAGIETAEKRAAWNRFLMSAVYDALHPRATEPVRSYLENRSREVRKALATKFSASDSDVDSVVKCFVIAELASELPRYEGQFGLRMTRCTPIHDVLEEGESFGIWSDGARFLHQRQQDDMLVRAKDQILLVATQLASLPGDTAQHLVERINTMVICHERLKDAEVEAELEQGPDFKQMCSADEMKQAAMKLLKLSVEELRGKDSRIHSASSDVVSHVVRAVRTEYEAQLANGADPKDFVEIAFALEDALMEQLPGTGDQASEALGGILNLYDEELTQIVDARQAEPEVIASPVESEEITRLRAKLQELRDLIQRDCSVIISDDMLPQLKAVVDDLSFRGIVIADAQASS